MHLRFLIRILCFFFGTTAVAMAGGMEGGGGNAIVCNDGSVQLYDFVEAANPIFLGANIPRTTVPTASQIAAAIQKLQQVSALAGYNLNDYLSLVKSRIVWISNGTMPPSNDFGPARPIIVPSGCSLQGLAYYDASNRLFISQTLFDAMSPTDQAGLMVHEAAYYFWRTNRLDFSNPPPPTSDQIRELVGEMFAQNLSVSIADASQILFVTDSSGNYPNWYFGPWNCSLIGDCANGVNWGAEDSSHGIFEVPHVGAKVVAHFGGSSTATVPNGINCYSSISKLLWSVDLPANQPLDVDISQCRYATTALGLSNDGLVVDGAAMVDVFQGSLIVGHP